MRDGVYQVRLAAIAQDAAIKGKVTEAQVDALLTAGGEETGRPGVGHRGRPARSAGHARVPAAAGAIAQDQAGAKSTQVNGLAAPAPASLPYTVYWATCTARPTTATAAAPVDLRRRAESRAAPAARAAPTQYAMNKGLDFLITSEHNHMYDGSTSTNASADPTTAKALYQSGLTAAASFNAAHPSFLALYGLEWGVINNGGHMNIFNTPKLLEWEYNSCGQLIGDIFTAKSDYAACTP